jgi:hypothetical protein
VAGAPNPESFTLTLDGHALTSHPTAAGDFVVHAVSPGAHTVGVVAPDGMRGAYALVQCVQGKPVAVGPVKPVLGGQIAGMVTKATSTGSLVPVPRVLVVATPSNVWPPGPRPATAAHPAPIGGGGTAPTFGAITNAQGSYVIRAVPEGGYDVSVVVPGFTPGVVFVPVMPGRTAVADFTLYPAPEQGVGTVEGVVTGAKEGANRPIEGAKVTVTVGQPWPVPVPAAIAQALAQAHGSQGGGGTSPPWVGPTQFSTLTDHAGHYSLNVPVGTHQIECWAEGWEWQGDQVTILKNKTTKKSFELREWGEPPPPGGGGGTPGGPPTTGSH